MAGLVDLVTAYPWVSITLTLLVLFAFTRKSPRRHYNLPPGPFSLPILGTLPFLGTDIREPLRRLSEKYGDIFTVYFGSRRVIVLNSYEAIKEAFVRQGNLLAGRPQDLFFVRDIQEGKGIVSSEREPWKEQRKLSHTILRDFGVGSSFMEERIVAEAVHLRDLFAENTNTPWSPAYSIQAAVANVIYSVCFQHRRDYHDPDFIDYIDGINQSFEVLSNAGALTVFPALRHLPGDPFGYKRLMKSVLYTREHVYAKNVREHRQTYQKGVVRDFIDAYLTAMYQEEQEGRDTNLCDHQLERLIGDLVGAGTETTTSTLRWGLVYMLRNPEVQRKVQEEIDDVIGKKTPTMRDRQNMPYTEACLHEIQRIGDIVPLGVPHSTLEDVSLLGYDIPRDTMVISNLYSVHFNPDLWPDPYKFDPTRFLDKEGKLHRPETLIPFSMGKRVCLGESLARMELFLFFVIMLQNFTFQLPDGEPLPQQTGVVGVTHMPKPFKVVLLPRA